MGDTINMIKNLLPLLFSRNPKHAMKKMSSILLTLIIVYLAVIALYYFAQTSMLFFPRPIIGEVRLTAEIEEVTVHTGSGNILKGWLCKERQHEPQKLVIYFGGNAEEVSHMIDAADKFDGYALLLVNYPGYGASTGKPGERSFFEAALAVWDYAAGRSDIDERHIVLLGRSIGTGSAVYLAHQRAPAAVILASPFESIKAVASSKLPFLPVGLLLRHRFDSQRYAKEIDAPLLAFYGSDDNIIPPRHSKKLASKWKGAAQLIELDGYGHNDIFQSTKLWLEINAFLESLQQKQSTTLQP